MLDRASPPSRRERQRQQERERKRRTRARERAGEASYRVQVPEFEILDALIRSGRLTEDGTRRRALIEQALSTVLAEWASRWEI